MEIWRDELRFGQEGLSVLPPVGFEPETSEQRANLVQYEAWIQGFLARSWDVRLVKTRQGRWDLRYGRGILEYTLLGADPAMVEAYWRATADRDLGDGKKREPVVEAYGIEAF